MKKLIHVVLTLFIAMSGMAQTISDAFYVYRNDGQFNAFFRDEVKSIEYSYYDADSIRYDEVVTQVITTIDSVFVIPLAVIDSVSFVQPEPIYEDDAKEISEPFVWYIISIDSASIRIDKNIPHALLPDVGSKLVQLHFSDMFPDGFVGKVTHVQHDSDCIKIEYEKIAIEDAVKRFYGIYRLSSAKGNVNLYSKRTQRAQLFNKQFLGRAIPISADSDFWNLWRKEGKNTETTFGLGCELSAIIEPTLNIKVTVSVDDIIGINPKYSINVFSDLNLEETISPYGAFCKEIKRSFIPDMFSYIRNIPIVPGLNGYYDIGFKVSGEADFGCSLQLSQKLSHQMIIDVYPTVPNPLPGIIGPPGPLVVVKANNFKFTDCKGEWKYLFGNAEIKVGPYVELGFSVINHHFAKFGAEIGGGVQLKASMTHNLVIWGESENNTNYYDRNNENCKIERNFYLGANVFYAIFEGANLFGETSGEKFRAKIGGDIPIGNVQEAYLLPKFSNVQLIADKEKPSTMTACAYVERNCLFPMNIGFALFNSNGELIEHKSFSEKKYKEESELPFYKVVFEGLNLNENYKVFPTVKFLDKNVLCSPSAELQVLFPAKISEFKQTGSHYLKDGYTYKGKVYSYQYDYAVTMEFDNSVEVEDWGYVYEDEKGDTAHISFMGCESPYTNTQYVFYRNEKRSVAKIYEYVKYPGDENFCHGEPKNLNLIHIVKLCPDDHHPHMIDLGLPSGTKWACCNIGAYNPEEAGGYFSWGETMEKNSYHLSEYSLWSDLDEDGYGADNEFAMIGNQISGSVFDVARYYWQGNWSMPTLLEIEELIGHCQSTWFEYKGCSGALIYGSQQDIDNAIFIPAVGYKYVGNAENYGVGGSYWTGTLYPENSKAYQLSIAPLSPSVFSYWGWRANGQTVRAVCK